MPTRLHKEIEKLKKHLLSLSAAVEDALRLAVLALEARDAGQAQMVIDRDPDIDRMEVELEEECLKILALHQPVAIDLRFIIAVLKINNDLERIGDLAVNIAEHALYFAGRPPLPFPFDFDAMAQKAQEMLRESLNALVGMDTELAKRVCVLDDEIDAMNRRMYRQVEEAMRKRPDEIEALMHTIGVSRHIVYMIDGEIIRHRAEQYKPFLDRKSEPDA
jgi:phosphate transport system protein